MTLPFASRSHTFTNPITALFTASFVTGLVVDTSNYWSFLGQLIILLIQVGCLDT
ncbi:hypothetical protein [Caldisericum exile]|uniref:hypothetical protein n=1 Tax=Caldisericum exile TaxID=693075 RepID=UPI003C737E00